MVIVVSKDFDEIIFSLQQAINIKIVRETWEDDRDYDVAKNEAIYFNIFGVVWGYVTWKLFLRSAFRGSSWNEF